MAHPDVEPRNPEARVQVVGVHVGQPLERGQRFGVAPLVRGLDRLGKRGEIPLRGRIQGQHGREQE